MRLGIKKTETYNKYTWHDHFCLWPRRTRTCVLWLEACEKRVDETLVYERFNIIEQKWLTRKTEYTWEYRAKGDGDTSMGCILWLVAAVFVPVAALSALVSRYYSIFTK